MTVFEGRTALVTGGSRGIGAAITRALVARGARVHLVYVDRDAPARALAAELGERAVPHRCDVTDEADLAVLTDGLDALDFVVHAAAAAPYGPLLAATPRQWQFAMDVNARSVLLVAQACAPLLARSDQARLITVTNSAPGKVIPGAGLLAAAKAATEALTRYLAHELAADGIVVNCVRPGLVATDVLAVRPDYATQLADERAVTPWPEAPVTTAAAVADAVAMLCLPESRWISGEILTVDGGYRLWGHHRAGR